MSTNYRVLVQFDVEKSVFVAYAPELEECSAEGASRAEAIAKVEDEIGAQLANIRERGGRAPAVLDSDEGASGEVAAKVSRSLHRELLWQARSEGVELGQLVAEMLAAGLDARRRAGGGRRPGPQGQPEERGGNVRDDRGPRRGGPGGRGDGRNDGRYHNIMEDRASFVEYVRSLEQGGGGRGPGGGGRGPGGGGRGPGGGGRGPGGGGRGPGGGGRGPGGGGRGPGAPGAPAAGGPSGAGGGAGGGAGDDEGGNA